MRIFALVIAALCLGSTAHLQLAGHEDTIFIASAFFLTTILACLEWWATSR